MTPAADQDARRRSARLVVALRGERLELRLLAASDVPGSNECSDLANAWLDERIAQGPP